MRVLYFFLVFTICLSGKRTDTLLLQENVSVFGMQPASIDIHSTRAGKQAAGVAHEGGSQKAYRLGMAQTGR
jgi:hypothetical protein